MAAKALILHRVVQATWLFTGLYVVTDVAAKVSLVPYERRLRVGVDGLAFHGGKWMAAVAAIKAHTPSPHKCVPTPPPSIATTTMPSRCYNAGTL